MRQILLVFGAVTLLYFLIRLIAASRRRQLRRDWARAQGCLPPPSVKSAKWPQMFIMREALAAVKDDRGPQFVIDKMDAVSPNCHTVQVPIVPLIGHGVLVTRDPDNIMALYKNIDFDISANRQESFKALLGRGILTSTGEAWKHSRALVRPQFAKGLIGDLDAKQRHLSVLMGKLPVDGETRWTDKVDLHPLLLKYGLDVSTEFLYAHSTNSLSASENEVDVCGHFDAAKDWIEHRGLFAKFSWLVGTGDFKQHCEVVHGYVDGIVARHLRGRNGGEKTATETRFSLLDELSKITSDPLELRNETLNLLSASKGTIACLVSWAIYHLARNPEIYRRLREAVAAIADGGLESLQECEYLQWVINETLRAATIVPMNDRVALRDGVMPRGGGPDGSAPVFVPAGTQVLIPIYAVHHRKDLWGPDADVFRPERWDNLKPGWEFLPFSSGRRKCLGQHFAKTEAAYVLSRFCQRYDAIENVEEGSGRLRLHTAIENSSGSGVQVRLHEAPLEGV